MSVSFVFAAIAQINLHWQEDEEAVEKRATIKELKIFVSYILKLFFYIFSITLLYLFIPIRFLPTTLETLRYPDIGVRVRVVYPYT